MQYANKVDASDKTADVVTGMRAIEDGVRHVYDRIDTIERHAGVAPSDLEPITAELHRQRSSWWVRIVQAISFFLVTSADYTITRRLNFGRL